MLSKNYQMRKSQKSARSLRSTLLDSRVESAGLGGEASVQEVHQNCSKNGFLELQVKTFYREQLWDSLTERTFLEDNLLAVIGVEVHLYLISLLNRTNKLRNGIYKFSAGCTVWRYQLKAFPGTFPGLPSP